MRESCRSQVSLIAWSTALLVLLSMVMPGLPRLHAQCDPLNPVKIMPLGDSITYGTEGTYGGYRGYLYDLLAAEGYNFDFVGTLAEYLASDDIHPGFDMLHLRPLVVTCHESSLGKRGVAPEITRLNRTRSDGAVAIA